jgi:hypothetical protein
VLLVFFSISIGINLAVSEGSTTIILHYNPVFRFLISEFRI